ncbi:transcription termination/antitermination protein NusG [Brucella thiophenivorans]|uniref:Transcription termination factor nusG family protein n=1 Tax=Brucella thiophenivorans TaxID=571255 RepID=A0A256FVT2_9HYPH|nr:transcription termination/antitermination NusG family protein [Brucella thiophenivorans]OYR18934.1 transcription termination factor nusG family protein [Brucella thiophenivorans]
MMMADKRLTDQAEEIDLTRCYAKLDRFMDERKRRRAAIEKAAVRGDSDSPWMVLQVSTGREITVHDTLIGGGIETIAPMKMGKKIHRRGHVLPAKKVPIFIGYLFVRCVVNNDNLACLLGFDHVQSILGGYENPFLVDSIKVLSFNDKAGKGHFDYEVPQRVFQRGMKVRIKDGIFENMSGEVVTGGHTGKGDAVVDINFFGRSTHAIMPLAILEPL